MLLQGCIVVVIAAKGTAAAGHKYGTKSCESGRAFAGASGVSNQR